MTSITTPPGIAPPWFAEWSARLGERLADLRASVDPDQPDPVLDARRDALRRVRVGVRRVRYALADAADLHALLATCATAEGLEAERELYAALGRDLPATTAVRREFYVYLHRAPGGAVFYVGKGRARRAWSKARTDVWRRYVAERLGGRYSVEIHRDGLTHAEQGARLVNWINPSRDFDAAALERATLLRTETLGRVGTAQFLERTAPEEALRRYRLALADVRLYCRWPVERGLLGELREPDRQGEPVVLDRLTRLLERLGRAAEILAVANDYFAEFPDAVSTPAGARVRRRCERAAAGRLQGAAPPALARPRRRRVLG
jgi:hypothetical protein